MIKNLVSQECVQQGLAIFGFGLLTFGLAFIVALISDWAHNRKKQ